MSIQGIHHITLVCANAQHTIDFYTQILGLCLIKQTVNFDDPGSYHLYFGNQLAQPGSVITFFEWPNAPKGYPGLGGTHHLALCAADESALLKWKRRLIDLGIPVHGPYDRHYFKSIYFRDPDGVLLEIATNGPGWAVDEAPDQLGTAHLAPPPAMIIANRDESRIREQQWPNPVTTIAPEMDLEQGLHHITAISANIERTHAFYAGLLGMRRLKMTDNFDDPGSAHWYWGVDQGEPGTVITYFERGAAGKRMARIGIGQTHHFALKVADEVSQLEWREKLIRAGLPVSPVMDRIYFKSIYTRDPDGHIVEIATAGPGFTVDEDMSRLGRTLQLPPWLEPHREDIERTLTPIRV
ncbi:Putative ring-cleaving dioxygenase MhqO [Anaerolineae bacterium]|nr:Putative ring-cleaving dioxygenase MhqO [Anaerolineae bacterium]